MLIPPIYGGFRVNLKYHPVHHNIYCVFYPKILVMLGKMVGSFCFCGVHNTTIYRGWLVSYPSRDRLYLPTLKRRRKLFVKTRFNITFVQKFNTPGSFFLKTTTCGGRFSVYPPYMVVFTPTLNQIFNLNKPVMQP